MHHFFQESLYTKQDNGMSKRALNVAQMNYMIPDLPMMENTLRFCLTPNLGPKTTKIKVLIPRNMGYVPKNQGCGFAWHRIEGLKN